MTWPWISISCSFRTSFLRVAGKWWGPSLTHFSSACRSFLNYVRQRYLLLLLNGESICFLFLNSDVEVLFLWVFKKTLHGKLEQQPRVWSRERWAITDLPKFESLRGRIQCSSSHGLHKTTKSKRTCLRVYIEVNSSITHEEEPQVSLSSLSMIWSSDHHFESSRCLCNNSHRAS